MTRNFAAIFSEWEKENSITDKDTYISKNSSKYSKNKKEYIIKVLDLHGYTKETALKALRDFIYNSQSSYVVTIKIIHGIGLHSKGKRVLKDSVKEWLTENHHIIRNFRPGKIGEGSGGVTIAYLKAK